MRGESSARALTYQVLDEVLADQAVTAGARGAMFSVIDSLRGSSAPIEDVRRAENISIEMHKLEWALQRRDEEAARAALHQLRALAASCLDSRIGTRDLS